ncbi:sulfatase [Pedobacter psychrodurus]|uniref:sulfatase n=1 Tax=Pedobacter psychrodurus TaxID=2530456 RepID=UPI00292FDAD0|nr:sulfatase [Pedobacter psychrodurus]
MKSILALFVFSVLTIISVKAQTQRPNIIVFLVDDMGWQDTSLPFWNKATALNKIYHTPNMERMAKEGMKFTNAYAAPVCTPSRVAMLTGVNPAHAGITNWTNTEKDKNTDAVDGQFLPTKWNINGLSPVAGVPNTLHATPFPQLLKDAGYFTIHVGKAHWAAAGTPGANPYNMGFMVNIAGHAAGNPQSYLPKENYGNITGKATPRAVPDMEEYFGSETFLTEALTLEALKTLDAPIKNKQPFFLNMAHYAVHVPIQGDKRFLQKYLDAGIDSTEAMYASLVEGMDKSLGDIMDFLKKKGVEKNTLIIFMSDNGGLSLASERGGAEHTQNLPLKAGKGSVYEGGIREPMIVKYPALIKPATVTNQYVIIEDFFPTLLELAGVKKYKTVQQIDGKSFTQVLKNPAFVDNNRSLIWHYPNKWNNAKEVGINYFSAIRKGDWKLVYNLRNGKKELYNLKDDIGETKDLATKNLQKTNELEQILGNQLKTWNAPMPVYKTNQQPVAWPASTQQ